MDCNEREKQANEKDKENISVEFLKWNYEQCQAGYNSRDKVTGDIFSKMVQVFTSYIIVFALFAFLLSNLIDISDTVPRNYWVYGIVFILIWVSGLLSLGALLSNLESMFSCKAELRAQCYYLERKLAQIYPVTKYGRQQWMCIETRRRHLAEKFFIKTDYPLNTDEQCPDKNIKNEVDCKNKLYEKNINKFVTTELDGESGIIRAAAWIIIVLWILFLLLLILCLSRNGSLFIGQFINGSM